MQNVPFYIAYLLTRHECVIIPGLGAFVVSSSNREKTNRWGILTPPENFLGFNSEITHNDGLLADAIAKENSLSYPEANAWIDQYVASISHSLNEGKKVQIPGVGTLYLKDNKHLFQPDRTLSCNAFNYGLTGFSLPYLKDIRQQANTLPQKKNKKVVEVSFRRKFIIYAGAIAAALIAMCIIPTPLNDGRCSSSEYVQYASLVRFSTQNTANEETSALRYYLVIALSPDQASAEKTLAELQSKGFENAALLSIDGKYLIYTYYFEDKAEAEKSLIQFKKNYPMYADAWLLPL